MLFGFDEPSMIWYLKSNKEVQIVGTVEEFVGEYEKNEPICAIVRMDKMVELAAGGFKKKKGGANRWVKGVYLGKWRREDLWVGVNQAGVDRQNKNE